MRFEAPGAPPAEPDKFGSNRTTRLAHWLGQLGSTRNLADPLGYDADRRRLELRERWLRPRAESIGQALGAPYAPVQQGTEALPTTLELREHLRLQFGLISAPGFRVGSGIEVLRGNEFRMPAPTQNVPINENGGAVVPIEDREDQQFATLTGDQTTSIERSNRTPSAPSQSPGNDLSGYGPDVTLLPFGPIAPVRVEEVLRGTGTIPNAPTVDPASATSVVNPTADTPAAGRQGSAGPASTSPISVNPDSDQSSSVIDILPDPGAIVEHPTPSAVIEGPLPSGSAGPLVESFEIPMMQPSTPGAGSPEPSALLLLAIGGGVVVTRPRSRR